MSKLNSVFKFVGAAVLGLVAVTAVPQVASAGDNTYYVYNKGNYLINVYFKYNGKQDVYKHAWFSEGGNAVIHCSGTWGTTGQTRPGCSLIP